MGGIRESSTRIKKVERNPNKHELKIRHSPEPPRTRAYRADKAWNTQKYFTVIPNIGLVFAGLISVESNEMHRRRGIRLSFKGFEK